MKADPYESSAIERVKPTNIKLECTYPEGQWTDDELSRLVQEVEKSRPVEKKGQANCEKMAWRVFKNLLGRSASLPCPIDCEGIDYTLPDPKRSLGCMHLTKDIEKAYNGYISDEEEIDLSGIDTTYTLDTEQAFTYHICAQQLNQVMEGIHPREDYTQPFGLLGVERIEGWHQLVWLKRSEGDVVLIDMNHKSHMFSLLRDFGKHYADVKKCSLLRFAKDCPMIGPSAMQLCM